MVINMKPKMIISAFAVLISAALTACCMVACTPAPENQVHNATNGPSTTEHPKAPEVDTHFCTLTDGETNREFFPTLVNEEYRFYLPGGTNLNQLTLNCHIGTNYSVTIDGKTFTESMQLPVDFSKTQKMEITFTDQKGNASTQRYTFVASSANILCLNINESLGAIAAMHGDANHETYCYGTLSYIATEGQYDCSSAFSLKGRGNATWEDEKKGYALKLYESQDYNEKNKIALSGLGRSANWVLVANHRDRTLLRNALAQTLAAKLGMTNAVKFVFVDLYMNGEYLGLYMLMEKIEIGKDQVDIIEATADNVDGGYLLEFDNYSDTPQVRLKQSGLPVTINAPSDLSSYTAIEKLLNEAEIAITNPNGYNRQTGKYWYDYIDINSFAILWMVREYTMDYDANVNFRFYYDPSDEKFHGGPVWDFDNSMARSTGNYANPEFALIESGDRNQNCWLTKLMQFDAFREEIVKLYHQHSNLFNTSHSDSIYALANRYYAELSYSIEQNFIVWKNQLANPNWNVPKRPTYNGHFKILTDFLKNRNVFWKTYIPQLTEQP